VCGALLSQYGVMTFRVVALALGASVLVLAGCAPAFEAPPAITYAEVKKLVHEQNLEWWNSMFPDEPMPQVDPIEYVDPESSTGEEVTDCLRDADLDGISIANDGSWSATGTSTEQMEDMNRAQFVCAMQYPYDIRDPEQIGYLSDEQTAWIWSYNRERLVPCLQLMGYSVVNRSSGYVAGSNEYWSPYFDIWQQLKKSDWDLVDARCPQSPVGPDWRPYLP